MGDDSVLFTITAGGYFGEGLVLGRRRVATCLASTFCEMFVLDKADILNLFHMFPVEAAHLYHSIQSEVRAT